MKVYIYPAAERHLVAIATDPDRVLAQLSYGPELDETDSVLSLRDHVRDNVPGGPHRMTWVPDPHAHPVVSAFVRRREAEHIALDPTPSAPLCDRCAHSVVCMLAIEAERIGADITRCQHFVEIT